MRNAPVILIRIFLFAAAIACGVGQAVADEIPSGWLANNMRPVGYTWLDSHPAPFKIAIRQVGGRWYLYAGHTGVGGISITDVTDPADPKLMKFVAGPAGTTLNQVTLHDNIMITGLSRPLTEEMTSGKAGPMNRTPYEEAAAEKPYQEGVAIWDISDPVNPKQLSHWEGHAAGTHRNGYPGGNYAYLSATVPGFRGNILLILDVSDPAHPKEAGRWWYPGQKAGEPQGEVAPSFHGPANISPDGKMASMGYTPGAINLDITDIAHPKLIGKLTLIPPFADTGTQSVHSVLPLWDRHLLYVNSEAMRVNCKDQGANYAGIIDNNDPAKPVLLSLFPVPRPPADAPFKDFCDKGGRFGPHNVNQEIHMPDVEKPGSLIYLTYFNAGLRVFDIRDPRLPTETGWFIPPNPPKPMRSQGGMLAVNQTQDVLVDTRGNIYITDSAWGIWILRYTGPDQPAPTAG
jgi:hypothetical protein